ncbi:MAG TPA: phospholipase D family protein [Burkholderiales bacterium]|jgi:putative cardiolipin synthase|nr:phospholipase D family protein [Burkholderiales bacterium]
MLRIALAVALLIAGCAGLPAGIERAQSSAFGDTSATRLGRALAPTVTANRGKSGIYSLADGRDAFAARVLLARAAEKSLDVQYYILRADITGGLFCEALWQAAERGVRVRLLLDDTGTHGLDPQLAALDAHPNIEVRLFNPYANRGFRLGEMLTDFSRVNRRMHNKSFTADNQATIVGGRNVGDEYFGAESDVAFADLDVLAAGAVVRDVSADFDGYWNSVSAVPVASLIQPAARDSAEKVRAAWTKLAAEPAAARYIEALRSTTLVQQLIGGTLSLDWAPARLVSDSPAKVLNPPERKDLHMLSQLDAAIGKPARELDLVSPYFVPTQEGTAALVALVKRGVKVRVLTNSLAATDVSVVHAGYSKYREELVRGGVVLYELKPALQEKDRERVGGSDASLHAKTFSIDRSRIFVGSFNFDPRSARLNTEMGVVADSVALASRLSEALDRDLARYAYEVRLAGNDLEWIDGAARHTSEPGAGFFKRAWIGFLSILPIEWLL